MHGWEAVTRDKAFAFFVGGMSAPRIFPSITLTPRDPISCTLWVIQSAAFWVRHRNSSKREGRVAPLVGRSVCFCEKRSTRSAKPPRSSRHRIVTRANLKPGLEHTSLQSPFLVPSRSIKPLRSTAILRLRRRCSTAESRRGILMEGRGGAPIALL